MKQSPHITGDCFIKIEVSFIYLQLRSHRYIEISLVTLTSFHSADEKTIITRNSLIREFGKSF